MKKIIATVLFVLILIIASFFLGLSYESRKSRDEYYFNEAMNYKMASEMSRALQEGRISDLRLFIEAERGMSSAILRGNKNLYEGDYGDKIKEVIEAAGGLLPQPDKNAEDKK